MDAEQTLEKSTETAGVFDTPPVIEITKSDGSTHQPTGETHVDHPHETTPPVKDTAEPKADEADDFVKYMKGEDKAKPIEPAEVKPIEPEVAKPGRPTGSTRDYSGLSEEETSWFKNMDRKAYDALRPKYNEYKELAAKKVEMEKALTEASKPRETRNLYDHEHAYTLTPQYNELSQAVQTLNFEAEYWGKQLSAIRKGEDWKPLMHDEKGQYVEGKPKPSNAESESFILKKFTEATQYSTQYRQQLDNFASQFSSRRSELVNGIRSYEDKYFPFFKDEKNPHQASLNQIRDAIPPEFRDHPLAGMLVKAMGTVRILNQNNQELTKTLSSRQVAAADKAKAGPTLGTINNGGAAPSKISAAVEEMPDDKFFDFMKSGNK